MRQIEEDKFEEEKVAKFEIESLENKSESLKTPIRRRQEGTNHSVTSQGGINNYLELSPTEVQSKRKVVFANMNSRVKSNVKRNAEIVKEAILQKKEERLTAATASMSHPDNENELRWVKKEEILKKGSLSYKIA